MALASDSSAAILAQPTVATNLPQRAKELTVANATTVANANTVTDETPIVADGESTPDHAITGRHAARGVALGLIAATGYSVANLALRKLATGDGGFFWDVWISGTKAIPTVIAASLMLILGSRKGQRRLPGWSALWPLFATALVMQFGGNLGFQLALREIGLAITVPIVFSSIIVSGAIAGRIFVGDPVSIRTAFSMTMMVVSIAFLSAAAHSGHGPDSVASSLVQPTEAVSNAVVSVSDDAWKPTGNATFGILIALVSGLSYGLCGVVIRRVVRAKLPIELTLFVFSVTGLLTLCPLSMTQLGVAGLSAISTVDWWTILAAGTFNAIGFFAITHALRYLTISRANVVNASQNAMCAVGAFVFFSESISTSALIGIGLTIVGLLTLDRK